MEPIEHDWVIEHYVSRPIGVNVHTGRVDEFGRWAYTATGAQEMAKGRGMDIIIPRFRQGQRLSMESAIAKVTALKQVLPELTVRARNVTTGDVIMGAILG